MASAVRDANATETGQEGLSNYSARGQFHEAGEEHFIAVAAMDFGNSSHGPHCGMGRSGASLDHDRSDLRGVHGRIRKCRRCPLGARRAAQATLPALFWNRYWSDPGRQAVPRRRWIDTAPCFASYAT